MVNYRLILIITLICLSILDLTLTYYYIDKYKKWQKDKPYNLIESNPLLVFLFNKFGLILGMIIGSIIILTLIYFISSELFILFPILLLLVEIWKLWNHYNNITLLDKLILKYPLGYIPESIFGIVIGNNKVSRYLKNKIDKQALKDKKKC